MNYSEIWEMNFCGLRNEFMVFYYFEYLGKEKLIFSENFEFF